MKTILGIDVGMNGALALYDGTELMIYDIPTHERNKTRRIDCLDLIKKIGVFHHDVDHVFIEQVNAFGMGASSAYNFGWSCGVIETAVLSYELPLTYVTPQVWKKNLNVPKDKDAARGRASQLMPKESHQWNLKKHHNRAEAALIALYGFNRSNFQ